MSTDVIFITFVACCRGKIEISIRHACILKTVERCSKGKSAIIYFSKAIFRSNKTLCSSLHT